MKVYKFSVVNWFSNNITDDKLDLTPFTDQAWFYLTALINSQHFRSGVLKIHTHK